MVWKRPGIDDSIARPERPPPAPSSADWLLGEALSSLHAALQRAARGEKLSAARLVQEAVERVAELCERQAADDPAVPRDPFAPARRFERRFPDVAAALPGFLQGYERVPESALAILEFLEARFAVPPAMAAALRSLGRRD